MILAVWQEKLKMLSFFLRSFLWHKTYFAQCCLLVPHDDVEKLGNAWEPSPELGENAYYLLADSPNPPSRLGGFFSPSFVA